MPASDQLGFELVVAPPGVGKSRLLSELAAELAGSGAVVFRAQLRPDLLSPFEPVGQLVRSAGLVDASERLRAAGIGEARASVVLESLEAVVAPAGAAPAEATERDQLFAAWLEGLHALSGSAPEAWLVEDVHWASPDVLAFLEFAVGAGHERLVVATARPALLESAPDWCAAAELLHLAPLPSPDVGALSPRSGRRRARAGAGGADRGAIGRQRPVRRGAPAHVDRHGRPHPGERRRLGARRRSARGGASADRPGDLRRAAGRSRAVVAYCCAACISRGAPVPDRVASGARDPGCGGCGRRDRAARVRRRGPRGCGARPDAPVPARAAPRHGVREPGAGRAGDAASGLRRLAGRSAARGASRDRGGHRAPLRGSDRNRAPRWQARSADASAGKSGSSRRREFRAGIPRIAGGVAAWESARALAERAPRADGRRRAAA